MTCACSAGQYLYNDNVTCLDRSRVCDGTNDCPGTADDETTCRELFKNFQLLYQLQCDEFINTCFWSTILVGEVSIVVNNCCNLAELCEMADTE